MPGRHDDPHAGHDAWAALSRGSDARPNPWADPTQPQVPPGPSPDEPAYRPPGYEHCVMPPAANPHERSGGLSRLRDLGRAILGIFGRIDFYD